MTHSRTVKLVSAVAGVAFVLSAVAPVAAGAATLGDLQAQLAALTAQIASMQGGSSTSVSFTRDLTVGSQGADVTALQQALVAKSYLSMPAGAAFGYFGGLTKAAVAKWQAAAGVSPAAGYFGPKSRAAFGGASTQTTTTTTTTTTGGTTTTTGSTSGSITTPGAEGILTVTAGPISNTVVNVGQKMVPVLTVRNQAQNSDIAVQRITVDLGSSTNIYNKVYQTLYVLDQGRVLASVPLNSSTVVQSGSTYVVSLTGFNFVVPKGTYKDLTIAADVYSSINTGYLGSYTVSVTANGVRGIDGAGIDQFGPASTISQSITVNASLVDNAIANISLDSASPQRNTVPVSDTTNGNYLKLPVLVFDLGAQNDAIHIHNMAVSFVTTGSPGSITAAYLYQGSTQISSASISSGIATFSNIQDGTTGANVAVNTTLPYTVKVDVTGVTSGSFTVTASTTATGTTLYNSTNSTVTGNGIAAGNTQTVIGKGPSFSLVSAPTIAKTVLSTDSSGNATTSYSATFQVAVTAIGANVDFGLNASTTNEMFRIAAINSSNGTATSTLAIYKNGAIDCSSTNVINCLSNYDTNSAVTASFSAPSNATVSSDGTYFTIAQNQSAVVPVTFTWLVKNPGANTYAAQLQAINSTTAGSAKSPQTFMAGQTAWRTPSI